MNSRVVENQWLEYQAPNEGSLIDQLYPICVVACFPENLSRFQLCLQKVVHFLHFDHENSVAVAGDQSILWSFATWM